MKKAFRFGLFGLWLLLATGFLARWWFANPDSIPRFPSAFWVWLINLYGSQNGEELADLELLVVLGICFIFVSLFTLFGWLVLRGIQNVLTHHSTRAR